MVSHGVSASKPFNPTVNIWGEDFLGLTFYEVSIPHGSLDMTQDMSQVTHGTEASKHQEGVCAS